MPNDQLDPTFANNPEISLPDPPDAPTLLTVRAHLVDADPEIWRRLELRGELTLDAVHAHLQVAFGWQNSHLHRFDVPGPGGRVGPYFITGFDAREGDTGTFEVDARLDQVLRAPGETLRYTYDFGDDWEHLLVLEEVRPATGDDPEGQCVDGARACPPEDVGGIHRWNELAAALRADPDPSHLTGDLQGYADWLDDSDCDPDAFTVGQVDPIAAAVGMDLQDLAKFITEQDPGHGVPLPQPRAELATTLGRCSPQAADRLARAAARAVAASEPPPDEDDLARTMRPWQAVLDVIGPDGITLTSAGWLPPAAVQQILADGGIEVFYGKGNREQNTGDVAALREACTRAGLLRKSTGRLLLTKLGQRCRDSRAELMTAVGQWLVRDKDEFVQDAKVVTLLLLASDWRIGPNSRWAAEAAARGQQVATWEKSKAFWDEVAEVLSIIGWQIDPGAPLHGDELGPEVHRLIGLLQTGRVGTFEIPTSPTVRQLARLALFEQAG